MLIAGMVVFAFALVAQDSSVTSRATVDINGHRVMDGPEKSTVKSSNGFPAARYAASASPSRFGVKSQLVRFANMCAVASLYGNACGVALQRLSPLIATPPPEPKTN